MGEFDNVSRSPAHDKPMSAIGSPWGNINPDEVNQDDYTLMSRQAFVGTKFEYTSYRYVHKDKVEKSLVGGYEIVGKDKKLPPEPVVEKPIGPTEGTPGGPEETQKKRGRPFGSRNKTKE